MIRPRAKVNRSRKPSPGLDRYIEIDNFRIAAWCRDDKAQLPPEQVHLIFKMKDNPVSLLVRFHSPDTIGFMIEELAKYRKEVWPEAEPVKVD